MTNNPNFFSRHFKLERLADGVYAAIHDIHDEKGWSGCNTGIIDLGDRTIIYDAFEVPEAAAALKDAAYSLTGHPVSAVINSHYHNDHIWGNQSFPAEVDIIATRKTRELIETEGTKEIQWYTDTAADQLESFKTQLAQSSIRTEQAHLNLLITYYQAVVEILPILQIRLPNLTFTGELSFMGTKRSAILIPFEGGHCGSDAILHLPEDGIIFMEDILFVEMHPYLPESNPEQIKNVLTKIKKLEARCFVPGHGPVSGPSGLDWMVEYIDTLQALVKEEIDQGASEEEAGRVAIPEKYTDLILPNFFRANLKFLYTRQKQMEKR